MGLIQNTNYNIQGYHKEFIFDAKGDLVTVNYYKDYDGAVYSDLKVSEIRTFTRDVTTGLLTTRDMVINFHDEGEIRCTKTAKKYYEPVLGFEKNKKARQNLINNASMYLFEEVGKTDATVFWKLVKDEVDDYRTTGDMTLLTSISNSTEPYMTGVIKTTLDTILNVLY
jgi:hypothetical protein